MQQGWKKIRGNFSLNGEVLEEVDSFKYLDLVVNRKGGVVDYVNARINERAKVGERWWTLPVPGSRN